MDWKKRVPSTWNGFLHLCGFGFYDVDCGFGWTYDCVLHPHHPSAHSYCWPFSISTESVTLASG
jgi:hypothetical protein